MSFYFYFMWCRCKLRCLQKKFHDVRNWSECEIQVRNIWCTGNWHMSTFVKTWPYHNFNGNTNHANCLQTLMNCTLKLNIWLVSVSICRDVDQDLSARASAMKISPTRPLMSSTGQLKFKFGVCGATHDQHFFSSSSR